MCEGNCGYQALSLNCLSPSRCEQPQRVWLILQDLGNGIPVKIIEYCLCLWKDFFFFTSMSTCYRSSISFSNAKQSCLVRFPLEKLNRSLFSSYYDCKVLLKTYINNTCVGGQMTQKFISSRSTNTLHFSHTLWRSRSSPPLPGHHVINFLHRSHVISHY